MAWLGFPIVVAAAGILVAVISETTALRLGTSRVIAYIVSLLIGLGASLLLIGFTGVSVNGDGSVYYAFTAMLLYLAWWFIFLNFSQSFDSSLRVQLLKLVVDSGGRLSRDRLAGSYNDMALLQTRLTRLLKGGYVIERNGHLFVVSVQLKLIALFFRALKITLTGYRSEFDRRQ